MKYVLISLRILFGLFFIFSGIVKLYPIETFELSFVDLGIVSWKLAPFIARLIIAYEILLGIFIVINLNIKAILKQSFGLLLFFTGFLIYLLIVKGDEGNCGCFGSQFYVTPSQSIIKNVFLLVINILLLKKVVLFEIKYKKIAIPILIVSSIATPFILNPIQLSIENLYDIELPYTIDYLNEIPKPIVNNREIDLSQGENIIALFSLGCQHCKHAAYKLKIAEEKYNLPPIYVVFKGSKNEEVVSKLDELKDNFFKESNSNFPYSYFNDERIFKMTKGIFPTILHVNNGSVIHVWHGSTLTFEALEALNKTDSD